MPPWSNQRTLFWCNYLQVANQYGIVLKQVNKLWQNMEEFEDNRHDITEILLEVVLNTITLYRHQRVIRIRISCLHKK
jgi:hypothetical protein